jgi:hypothetical protein
MSSLSWTTAAVAWVMVLAAAAPAYGQQYQEWDQVEVYDPENDVWDRCTVGEAFPGAYKVRCDFGVLLKRDVHVRKIGEPAVGETTAQAVNGPPFKRNDVVEVTPTGLPNKFQLCIVVRSYMSTSQGYDVDCGSRTYRVLADWVRKDRNAP